MLVLRSSGPPLLHLTGQASAFGPALGVDAAGPGPAASNGGPGWGGFVLDGSLPQGPSSDTVRRLTGHLSEQDVVGLATAFGLTSPVQSGQDSWVVVDGSRKLRVGTGPGAPWAYGDLTGSSCADLIDAPTWPSIAPDDVSVGCASAVTGTIGGSHAAGTPAPSHDQALSLAQPILVAAGMTATTPVVTIYPAGPGYDGSANVSVEPPVDGLATSGWSTSLSITKGTITEARGWWPAGVTVGDSYPLISAKQAFARLAAQPVPEMGMPCMAGNVPGGYPSTGVMDPCAPRHVTGATYGLMFAWDDGRPLLVPAWLFQVAGTSSLTPVIAVQPQFLGQPTAPTASPGGSGVPGATGGGGGKVGSGSSGGSVPTGAPETPASMPPNG
jgi:hypothetical protein